MLGKVKKQQIKISSYFFISPNYGATKIISNYRATILQNSDLEGHFNVNIEWFLKESSFIDIRIKVIKSQKQIIFFSILPKNEQKTSILVARILL